MIKSDNESDNEEVNDNELVDTELVCEICDDNKENNENRDQEEGEEEEEEEEDEEEEEEDIISKKTKVLKDFLKDLLTTFPELNDTLDRNLKYINENLECENEVKLVFEYIKGVYPEQFFDILYKNNDIFNDKEKNTKYLPGVDFSILWNDNDISDNTRETIWKYLQLILFIIIGEIEEGETFGESAKLFEAINEDELKDKLVDAINNIQDIFDISNIDVNDISGNNTIPNPEDIHEHLNGLLGGKLGSLAKEIAEETVEDMNLDINEDAEPEEVFQKMFKNPKKLMNLVSNVGSKLDSKIKSGKIKESELMEEAAEMMDKMKNMPGMEQMESILKNMGGGGKMNLNAMQSKLNSNLKQAKTKERMQAKLNQRRVAKEAEASSSETFTKSNNEEFDITNAETLVFSTGETVEKSLKKKSKKKKKGKK